MPGAYADLSPESIQAALSQQSVPQTPAAPPVVQPINAGGAQLGAGLQMPAYGTISQAWPRSPPSPAPRPPAPMAKAADLAANNRYSEDLVHKADEERRQKLVSQLEAQGARPSAQGARPSAAKADATPPRPAASSGGGGDMQGQLKSAFGSNYVPPAKDYSQAKEALGMTSAWAKAHAAELAAGDEGERQAQANAAEQYRIGQLKEAELHGQADAQDVLAKEEQAKQQQHALEVERKTREVQRLHDDAANDRIDPGRIWNKNPAGSILAILGATAGGIQTAYTHGPNQALEMINKTVDRDIDAQKEAHAIKSQHAAAGDRMLDKLREQGLDEAGQRAAMRNMAMTKGQLGLQSLAAQSQNQAFKSNADGLHSAIEQEKAKNNAIIQQQIGATQYALDHPKANGGAAGGGEDAKDVQADMSAEYIQSHPDEVESAYGWGGRARNWLANKTGLNVDSDENKAIRANVEKLVGTQISGRVNDERLARHQEKYERTPEDIRRLSADAIEAELRKQQNKKKGGGAAPKKKAPSFGFDDEGEK